MVVFGHRKVRLLKERDIHFILEIVVFDIRNVVISVSLSHHHHNEDCFWKFLLKRLRSALTIRTLTFAHSLAH